MWNTAINDTLTCGLKVRKGISKHYLKAIWVFLVYVVGKGKGNILGQESLYFWRDTEHGLCCQMGGIEIK